MNIYTVSFDNTTEIVMAPNYESAQLVMRYEYPDVEPFKFVVVDETVKLKNFFSTKSDSTSHYEDLMMMDEDEYVGLIQITKYSAIDHSRRTK